MPSSFRSLLLLAVPALLWTALNCAKPLVIDDTAYHYYAEQMAQHPLDPYGFVAYWWDRPYVANEVLAPPVLPYWWSLAIRLFGERPLLWKLWLFPISLLFTGSLYTLCRRFATGLEWPLVWLTVLSPAFLPSLNLMLDIPALALALASVVVFLRACDRDSFVLAAAAGLLAGLAAETKYTALLAPAVMLLYAVLHGKLRLWPAAALLAAQVFISWELLMALLYGESHFLLAARETPASLLSKGRLLLPLLGILGGLTPALALLSLAALNVRRSLLVGVGMTATLLYLVVALVGATFDLSVQWDPLPLGLPTPDPGRVHFTLEFALFGLFGAAGVVIGGAVLGRLCPLLGRPALWLTHWRAYRAEIFLGLWLLLEVAGYFLLTPFPAVRRVLGVVVVATLLAGRLASRTCRTPERWGLIQNIVLYGACLGLGFAALDMGEAWTEQALAERAATLVRQEGGGDTWFVGHWGFQFYAERAGMQPVVTHYQPGVLWYYENDGYVPLPPPSRLHRGDWLVVPDDRLTQQRLVLDEDHLEPFAWLAVNDPIPLRTIMCYYSGFTPLEHRPEPTRLEVTIYRVTSDFDPVAHR